MRQSALFWRTLRADPADAEVASHRLLLRAGLMQRLASGIYALTPLGLLAERRVEALVRTALEAAGAQEVRLPFVQPLDLWRRSGRLAQDLPELLRLRDRRGEEYALALTAEEAMTELVRREGVVAGQLPLLLTQTGPKFRDELRPRGGLLRLREFSMQDAYSFDLDEDSMAASFARVAGAYRRIFETLSLDVRVAEAASGMMGGSGALEFQLPLAAGEDEIVRCAACGHVVNREVARRRPRPGMGRPPEALRLVETPGATTIAALAQAIGCAASDTLKVVFYDQAGRTVMAMVLGDRQVEEGKLRTLLGEEVRPLAAGEAAARGLVAGYAGPVGLVLPGEVLIVADAEVAGAASLVCGANRPECHLVGALPGRDFAWQLAGDIARLEDGATCPDCGGSLAIETSLELGHIFKLGTRYAERLGLSCTGADNQPHPLWMGSYGIGITRLLAAVVEVHHDERGIVWPTAVAPYQLHLLTLGQEEDILALAAEIEAGFSKEVLWDDRRQTAGVKFQDADLLGLPWRLTVSRRSLAQGGVELRRRRDGETRVVPREELRALLGELTRAAALPTGL
jgi:prolyl-tRNA synthetase